MGFGTLVGPEGPEGAEGPMGPAGASDVQHQNNWSSATSYVVKDQVSHNDALWIANANNTNSEPTLANSNWSRHSAKGDPGAQEIVVMGNQTMGQGVRLQEKRRRELAERDRRLGSWHSRGWLRRHHDREDRRACRSLQADRVRLCGQQASAVEGGARPGHGP
jgi:hypothetical protein